MGKPYWQEKNLFEMTFQEWESVCDGCAKCCLTKLQDEDTEQLLFTDVACTLLNSGTCRCNDYINRSEVVAGCVRLTPENVAKCAEFMPSTCSYRLLLNGEPLPEWHHLISGDSELVHKLGKSVQGRVRFNKDVNDELESYVVDWV